MSIEAMKATPHKQLIDELMDCRIPKTEREHAAAREIERLRQAIEEAEKQEPVAWRTFDGEGGYDYRTYDDNESYADDWNKRNPNHKNWVEPLYAHPPKCEWVSLTDDQIKEIVGPYGGPIKGYTRALFDKIDAKLRENNG